MNGFLHPPLLRDVVREILRNGENGNFITIVKFCYISSCHAQAVVDVFAEECSRATLSTNQLSVIFPGQSRKHAWMDVSLHINFSYSDKASQAFFEFFCNITLPYVKKLYFYACLRKNRPNIFLVLRKNRKLQALTYSEVPNDKCFVDDLGIVLKQCKDLKSLCISRELLDFGVTKDLRLQKMEIRVPNTCRSFKTLCQKINFHTQQLLLRFTGSRGILLGSILRHKEATEYTASVESLVVFGLQMPTDFAGAVGFKKCAANLLMIFPNLKKLTIDLYSYSFFKTYDCDFDLWYKNYCDYLNELKQIFEGLLPLEVIFNVCSCLPRYCYDEIYDGEVDMEFEILVEPNSSINSSFSKRIPNY